MRLQVTSLTLLILTTLGCARQHSSEPLPRPAPAAAEQSGPPDNYIGFDSNDYPGDAALPKLKQHFAFAGYWLTNPPGAHQNTWRGKRQTLLRNGFGFLVLANGRLEAEIKKAKRAGTTPVALGEKNAAEAVAAARREDFPAQTILYLDQEEGGRLTADQSAYLLAWTEAVARSGYLPGVYGSGQAVDDGPDRTITTAQDIREQVAAKHLHEISMWVYQDACPPANGCTLMHPPASTASGTPDVAAWQYAQSPRRKEITAACSNTYAADGNCYAPELPAFHLDLSVSASSDPSHGR